MLYSHGQKVKVSRKRSVLSVDQMLSDIFDDDFTISKGESREEEVDWEAYLPTVVRPVLFWRYVSSRQSSH